MEGLSASAARDRLAEDGPNELPRAEARTALSIIGGVLREPMLALLLGGAAIYLVLGDQVEAFLMLGLAIVSVGITIVQEIRSERVLEALRDLTSPRALVLRDGEPRRIAGREVVSGDILILAEGDRIAADARLVEAHDVQADESLLTGESVPVRKVAFQDGAPHDARPGGDGLPFVHAGTLVTRGSALAQVIATGSRTEIGRIGQSLARLETETPKLRRQTQRIVWIFGLLGAAVACAVVLLFGLARGDWLEALLAGIAVAMSMMPEEFPVVLAVFMAMGAWRISQARVLTRKASAIETLGSATVLCTDKTGTLTENRMRIAELILPDGASWSATQQGDGLGSPFRSVVETGVLASVRRPTDPMEKAFHQLADNFGEPAAYDGKTLVRSYPLRPDLLAMAQAWSNPEGGSVVLAAKGAPEAIARLCRMEPGRAARLHAQAEAMAGRGMRVLAVASADCGPGEPPATHAEVRLTFLGLVGLADPLRASVPAAIAECRSAGIRVVMITGDYPATARAIAAQAGIGHDEIVTGGDIRRMDDATLRKRAASACVFARIMPEQKLRIVEALKAAGHVVAMTGDGVNDAPSLKAAHIGIAMGGRGTDVAREASSVVLLDDDFSAIARAVRLGRRIYDNLLKALGFIIAVHVPIAGLALMPLLFGLPIILGPVHIVFMEVVIDPICSLVFEAEEEEDGIMQRPPRPPDQVLFSRSLIAWGVIQGVAALVLVGATLFGGSQAGLPVDELRALVFVSLIVAILGLVIVNRSFGSSLLASVRGTNGPLLLVLAAVSVVLAGALFWPPARALFRFGPLHAHDAVLLTLGGLALVTLLQLVKRYRSQPS